MLPQPELAFAILAFCLILCARIMLGSRNASMRTILRAGVLSTLVSVVGCQLAGTVMVGALQGA